MKKISSKIIVCIILVTLFWGGFGFVSNGTKTAFSINKAQASIADEKCGNTAPNSDVNSPAYTQWRTCRADATKAQAPIDNGYLAFLKDVGTNALAYLGEGAVRAATAVIGGVLQLIVIPVLGMLLRIVAACLDLAIKFTLDSGHISAVSDAINSVWTIVRNIFNITFIFILLWAAIQTIVGVAGANTKKIIADVVIAALLINFSLLITRIIIDAGNIIAVALYNLITSNDSITISTIIANNLQLGTLYATTGTTGSVFSTPFFIISALQFITILTAIITLGYAALLFLVRNVMLIFLMALSPVGFMGNVLPKVDEYSKMWRKNLYGMVFMAPIFLLLFYLIVKIGDGLTLSGSAAGINTDYTAYFKYMMIIILLIAATKMTKSMSGVAGEFTEKMGTLAAGAAIGVATGGLALAGRATLGRAASHIAQSETLTNAASKGGLGGIASRMALKSAVGTSKASFDARNTGGFKSATNMIGSQTGLKIDYNRGMKTQKDGYVGMADRQEKRELDTAKMINKGRVSLTKEEKEAITKKREDREQAEQDTINKNKTEIETLEAAKRVGTIPKEDEEKLEKLKKDTAVLTSKPVRTPEEKQKDIEKEEAEMIKEKEKDKKNERTEAYASQAQSSWLSRTFRNEAEAKEAADKVRKTTKPKDGKTLAAEAAELLAKEKAEAEGKPAAGTPAPAPAAAPAGGGAPAGGQWG